MVQILNLRQVWLVTWRRRGLGELPIHAVAGAIRAWVRLILVLSLVLGIIARNTNRCLLLYSDRQLLQHAGFKLLKHLIMGSLLA